MMDQSKKWLGILAFALSGVLVFSSIENGAVAGTSSEEGISSVEVTKVAVREKRQRRTSSSETTTSTTTTTTEETTSGGTTTTEETTSGGTTTTEETTSGGTTTTEETTSGGTTTTEETTSGGTTTTEETTSGGTTTTEETTSGGTTTTEETTSGSTTGTTTGGNEPPPGPPNMTTASGGMPQFVLDYIQDPNLKIANKWKVGFNSLSELNGHYIVPQNHRSSASHTLTNEKSVEGGMSHKAWMYGTNPVQSGVNTNHRAYPTFQMEKTSIGIVKTAVLVEFWVWTDLDMYDESNKSWLSLATLTSYRDNQWPRSYLINIDKEYRLHLMHVPNHNESAPDIFVDKSVPFPRGQWARVTAYIDYSSNNRFNKPIMAVWTDGYLKAASYLNSRLDPFNLPSYQVPTCMSTWDQKTISHAEQLCGLDFTGGLAQVHFGLYTPPLLSTGVVYNDKLEISEVSR